MPAIKCVSRRRDGRRLIPVPAIQAETPKERYKDCESEQTTLGGLASCYRTFLQEKAQDK